MQRKTIDLEDGTYADLLYVDADEVRGVQEHCTQLREHRLTGNSDIRHLACVPAAVVEAYCNDRGIAFADFMRDTAEQTRMLNDPALAGFRVHQGRV